MTDLAKTIFDNVDAANRATAAALMADGQALRDFVTPCHECKDCTQSPCAEDVPQVPPLPVRKPRRVPVAIVKHGERVTAVYSDGSMNYDIPELDQWWDFLPGLPQE